MGEDRPDLGLARTPDSACLTTGVLAFVTETSLVFFLTLYLQRVPGYTRYIYWVPEGRGHGRWTRYDFLALSLMIRGVLSPGSEALADR